MTKDYKHRAHRSKPEPRVSIWRWLVVGTLVGLFIFFLSFLRIGEPPKSQTAQPLTKPAKKAKPVRKAIPASKPTKPRFDFYTILPEQEVEIPESEIKIRKREERLGRTKPEQYTLQAGSFRNFKDADKLKAQLALLGIEARIETANIGNTLWNRVKIGPYSTLAGVGKVRDQLRQNNIDSVVFQFRQ